jgi:hypothetical protein
VSQPAPFAPASRELTPSGPSHGVSARTEASPDAQSSTVRLLAWRLTLNGALSLCPNWPWPDRAAGAPRLTIAWPTSPPQVGPSHLRVAMQLERQNCLMRHAIVRAFSARVDPCLEASYPVFPAISPTSQISAPLHWPKLAPWLLQRESHSSRTGVPWRSSPRQRIDRFITCNTSVHRRTHAAPPSGCDLLHPSDSIPIL